ncbi:unnamed protein product [Eretmochelys imbricata]
MSETRGQGWKKNYLRVGALEGRVEPLGGKEAGKHRKRALPKSACCIASLQKILQCKKLLKGMKKENVISKKASFSNYMISVLHCRKYESPAKDHIQHLFLKS